MRKLPRWVRHVSYAVAFAGINWELWRTRDAGLTVVSGALILVGSFCLAQLSYLVFPRRVKQ